MRQWKPDEPRMQEVRMGIVVTQKMMDFAIAVGRIAEKRKVEHHYLWVGPRGSGKTTLLRYLYQTLPESVIPVYVRGKSMNSPLQFLTEVLKQLVQDPAVDEALSSPAKASEAISSGLDRFSVVFEAYHLGSLRPESTLITTASNVVFGEMRTRCRETDKIACIIVDDIDDLLARFSKQRADPMFCRELVSQLKQSERGLLIATASSEPKVLLDEVKAADVKIRIEDAASRDDLSRYVRERVEEVLQDTEEPTKANKLVLDRVSYSPYYARMFCESLVYLAHRLEHLKRNDEKTVEIDLVEQAYKDMVMKLGPAFRVWLPSSSLSRRILRALASLGGEASSSQIAKRASLKPVMLSTLLNRLEQEGFVRRIDRGQYGLSIGDQVLVSWLSVDPSTPRAEPLAEVPSSTARIRKRAVRS